MRERNQKFSIELTAPARKALGEIALRWGGISRVAAIEMMIRRVGHLPPFEAEDAAPWFPRAAEVATDQERREILMEMMKPPVAAPEREAPAFVELEEALPGPSDSVTPVEEVEPDYEPDAEQEEAEPDPAVAPVVEAPAAEPAPGTLVARAPREFVRAWYDDNAPVWVQLLGADATNGLDLTAEQREALNDWQAGVDREAP